MTDPNRRLTAISITMLSIAFFIFMIRNVMLPLCVAGLAAIVLAPLHSWLRHRVGRFASLLLVLATLLLGVAPMLGISIGVIRAAQQLFAYDFANITQRIAAYVATKLHSAHALLNSFGIDAEPMDIQEQLVTVSQHGASILTDYLGNIAGATPSFLLALFLFFVALYFYLRDGDELIAVLTDLSPFSITDTRDLFLNVRNTVRGVFLGAMATALVQSLLTMGTLFLFDVPGAFLWSAFAFILSLVPIVGTTPITIGATLYLLALDRSYAAAGMVGAGLVIGLVDNVVRPLALGRQNPMPALLTLVAIFGGIYTLGAAGLFLGPVVVGIMLWIVGMYRRSA